ncbi:MAG TPA: hypothetical protein VIR13_00035 [Savagea sp.]
MEKIVLYMPSLPEDIAQVRQFFKEVRMKSLEKYDLSVGQFNIIYPSLYRTYKHLIQIDCLNRKIKLWHASQTEDNTHEANQFQYLIRFFTLQFEEKLEVCDMIFQLAARKEYK